MAVVITGHWLQEEGVTSVGSTDHSSRCFSEIIGHSNEYIFKCVIH